MVIKNRNRLQGESGRIATILRRYSELVFLCFGAWLLFSLDTAPSAWITGGGFALATALFGYKIFFLPQLESAVSFTYLPRVDLLMWYLVLLLIQSYISSFTLIIRMLTRRYNPKVVRIRTRLRSPLARTILANTISMIPGTLSMWMDGNHIYVHCFDAPDTHSIAAGRRIKERQEKILQRIFG